MVERTTEVENSAAGDEMVLYKVSSNLIIVHIT